MLSGIMWSNLMQGVFVLSVFLLFGFMLSDTVSLSRILSDIFSGVLPLSVSMSSVVTLNVMEPMFDPSVTATMPNHRHTTKQGILKGEVSLYH
jgi:hypothetical protein